MRTWTAEELLGGHAPFAACLAAAVALRTHALDRVPLSSAEAVSAWAAWSTVGAQASAMPLLDAPPQSALLFGLQCALFWLTGAGDAIARMAPALAGAAAVVMPWLLRPTLGQTAALALAVFLALDPLQVGYARLADGAVLASTACWVVVAGLLALDELPDGPRAAAWRRGMVMAAALAVAAGPVGWDLFLPLLACLAWRHRGHGSDPVLTPRVAALAASVVLLVATSGLAQWEGPSLMSAGVTGWLSRWYQPSGLSFADLWISILRYETFPLMLGVGGLIVSWSRRWSPLLLAWMAGGFVLTLRPGRSMETWLVLAPPLLVSASCAVRWLVASLRAPASRLTWVSTRVAAAAIVILVGQFVHGAFDVASRRHDSHFQPYAAHTEPAVRLLAADVARMQRRRAADGRLPVEVVTPRAADPVLAWYLRDERPLTWVAAPSIADPGTRLLIEPAGDESGGQADVYGVRHDGALLQHVRVR